MPELKPRSSELKAPEPKPTILEIRRKDRVPRKDLIAKAHHLGSEVKRQNGVQLKLKPATLVDCWTIRAEAQDLRANTQDLTGKAQHHRAKRFENQNSQS